jgi:hypothetical protein
MSLVWVSIPSLPTHKMAKPYQIGKTTRYRDVIFAAKPPGKRISSTKKRYYEHRMNRSDISTKKRL